MSQHIDPTPKQTDLEVLKSKIKFFEYNYSGLYIKVVQIEKMCLMSVTGTATATIPEWQWIAAEFPPPLEQSNVTITGAIYLQVINDNGIAVARFVGGGIQSGQHVSALLAYPVA